jgi:transcriptional regulator with XRE-family HTH domain
MVRRSGEVEEQWRQEFASRLREVMNSQDLTNHDLAADLEMSESRVRNWLAAVAVPHAYTIYRMATIYRWSANYLLTGRSVAYSPAKLDEIENVVDAVPVRTRAAAGKVF